MPAQLFILNCWGGRAGAGRHYAIGCPAAKTGEDSMTDRGGLAVGQWQRRWRKDWEMTRQYNEHGSLFQKRKENELCVEERDMPVYNGDLSGSVFSHKFITFYYYYLSSIAGG